MFTYRKEEILKKLDDAVLNMTGREISSKKDQEEIRAAVNRYFFLRQKALEDAIELLKSSRKSTIEQRENWNQHLGRQSGEAGAVLHESIKDKVSKPTHFTNVISEMITQESRFFAGLAQLLLPDIMKGKLLDYRKEFETEKKNLQEKWDKLLAENKGINTNISDAALQIINAYKYGFKKMAIDWSLVKAELTVLITGLRIAAGQDVTAPNIMEPITGIVEILKNLMVTSKDLNYRFEQLYRSEETVAVIMFGNTRKSVKEFLEKTNLDKAQKDYEEATRHADSIAKNMITDAQKADALKFIAAGIEATKPTLIEFTAEYNSFVDSFKEIFIGPVGDRTVNDLINKERWDFLKNEYKTLNIQAELKKIYDDTREWVNLDLFEMNIETKKKIDETLKKERQRLELALREADDPGILAAIKTFLTTKKDDSSGKIKNS